LLPYSQHYRRCPACGSLTVAVLPAKDVARVGDDDRDLYGREYWFSHQSRDFGYPDIEMRARADLPERCTHWLRAVLRFRLPPGRALEIGCAHGGFVALLRQAGFDASGLELSPTIVEFARRTFGVPVQQGPLEAQSLQAESFDVIALFDVLEHLQDPTSVMRRCRELLKPDGILLVQTPRVAPDKSYDDLVAAGDTFLAHFKPEEHLFLFTEQGARELLRRADMGEPVFLPAIFAHYDMFFVTGRGPLREHTDVEVAAAFQSPTQRIALALVDLYAQKEAADRQLAESRRDGDERLRVIDRLAEQLRASEADRAERLRVIEALDSRLRDGKAQGTAPRQGMRRWIATLARLAGFGRSAS
jgi:SAM-dependent methyltransferase